MSTTIQGQRLQYADERYGMEREQSEIVIRVRLDGSFVMHIMASDSDTEFKLLERWNYLVSRLEPDIAEDI